MTAAARPAVAIVALGAANRASIGFAIERADGSPSFVDRADALAEADAIVVPGVAHFGYVIDALDAANLRSALLAAIGRNVPFLGICAGFQMLFEGSEEAPRARGLGVFRGVVTALAGPKNPHMGWNSVDAMSRGAISGGCAYFAHGFAPPANVPDAIARTTYGAPFASVASAGSTLGVQFHPERSGEYGAALLRAFVARARLRRAR